MADLSRIWLSCLCPFGLYCSQRFQNYLAFQFFDFQLTWCNLFQEHVMCAKFDICLFIASLCLVDYCDNHTCCKKAIYIKMYWSIAQIQTCICYFRILWETSVIDCVVIINNKLNIDMCSTKKMILNRYDNR